MALSNEERERIREEEWVRLQAAEDFRRARGMSLAPRTIGLSVLGLAMVFLLFVFMRTA